MSTNEKAPISGKDIVIPDAAPPATLRQRMQELLGELCEVPSKHDHVRLLIEVCIAEGVTKGSDIRNAVTALGYDPKHVGMWLNRGCSKTSANGAWYKDAEGLYVLH